ncbi:CDP-glucose 4,6-dehydratase [Mycobacterium sp. 852014-52144_SCH5372336]|uniref:CDP-glucose 4,6-dehydratase n=1 Tax=Mycobacterium sp. 852014-52144_SCH5372336 TaxID=1834115 RepID=UPI0009ECF000|nr:CDP-glucose 4,6-dehydratase [Mycobacterium sp. 852014-52144_SCH5372336]
MTEPDEWVNDLARAFSGRSVLLTGHTGFKGSWLAIWLHRLGAHVTGYALDPPTVPSNYDFSAVSELLVTDRRADIRDREAFTRVVRDTRPDIVLHLAAQTVVLDSYREPVDTFDVNVVGTAVVLDVLRTVDRPCAVVVVTSDKCYANDESGRRFAEDDPLGGADPYSASKAGTELVAASYRRSFFPPAALDRHGVAVATARAGNVIGGGDWTPHGMVADIIRSVGRGEPVKLRRPEAIRPWQHVLEPLSGYLTLAARLSGPHPERYCDAWNFGPLPEDDATVGEVTDKILREWDAGDWSHGGSPDDLPEAATLRLSIDRAVSELGWRPRWRLDEAVRRTVAWQRRFDVDPRSARAACLGDIDAYMGGDLSAH